MWKHFPVLTKMILCSGYLPKARITIKPQIILAPRLKTVFRHNVFLSVDAGAHCGNISNVNKNDSLFRVFAKSPSRADQNTGGALLEFPMGTAMHRKSRVSSERSVCDNQQNFKVGS